MNYHLQCGMCTCVHAISNHPYIRRKSPKNIILAGLWFAEEKPPMQFFLKPIIEMLLELESGIHCGLIYNILTQ